MAAMNGCKPADFIVLYELVARGQPGGDECWPADGTLEQDAWLARNTVRDVQRRQLAAGTIMSRGMSARGTHVWKVKLPKAPDHHHGRMVLREFQHRLKPVPWALLIKLEALADQEGNINWSTPWAAAWAAWVDVDVDTILRGQRRLLDLGLINETSRRCAGRWFRVTMHAEAMAWIPGQRAEKVDGLPVQKQSGWQTGSKQVANATAANRKFDPLEPQILPSGTADLTPIDTGTYHGRTSTDCSRETLASPSAHAREEFNQDLISDSPLPSTPASTPQGAVEVETAPAPVPSQEGAEGAQTADKFTASRALEHGRLEWDTPQAPPQAEPNRAAAGTWRPVAGVLGDDEDAARASASRRAALGSRMSLQPSRRKAA
jgi:hypothetical protein